MSLSLFLLFGFVGILLLGLGWALWEPRERRKLQTDPRSLDEDGERHVTYLPQIRQALSPIDFDFLLKSASRELQRQVRLKMIRWKLLAGFAPVPQLDGLSNLVSGLSVRMEAAMKELGERAAAAAELASSVNRRGLDVV